MNHDPNEDIFYEMDGVVEGSINNSNKKVMNHKPYSYFSRRMELALLKAIGLAASLILGHKRYRTTIPHKIGSIRGAFIEVLNLLYYYARSERSFGYTSITVEPLNRCNIRCLQCPVNRGMQRAKMKMELGLFVRILEDSPFLERVHLTGWGEPLLHEDIFEMIRLARDRGLIATMVCNATLLDKEKAKKLLDSGISVITFSLDGVGETYEKVRGVSYEKVKKNILLFLELREKQNNKPFVEINIVLFDETANDVKLVRQEWEHKVDLVTVQPLVRQEGNRREKRCLHLWRRLVVLSSGHVVPCCVDAEGELILGDASIEKVEKIFSGPLMRRLRRNHIRGRFPKICCTCDEFYG